MTICKQALTESLYMKIGEFDRNDLVQTNAVALQGIFKELVTEDLWGIKSTIDVNCSVTGALLDCVASRIYAYYGVPTTRVVVAGLPVGFTILYRLKEQFNKYGYVPKFTMNQDRFFLKIDKQELPERGLGHILAVAHFIYDIDVMGGSEHIGYSFRMDPKNNVYVYSCKIDCRNAFHGFRSSKCKKWQLESGVVSRNISINKNVDRTYDTINFDVLPNQTKLEFIDTIIDIINTPKSILKDFFKGLMVTAKLGFITNVIDCLKQRKEELGKIFNKELIDHQLCLHEI